MSHYKPTRIRWGKVFASFIRGIAGIISRWPLILLTAVLVSPIGPHLRWQYTYHNFGSSRLYTDCEYLGSRGFVHFRDREGSCPIIAVIDRR